LKPTKGEIKIFGEKLQRKKELYRRLGYAPENAYYYDHLKGLEFLVFMGQLAGIPKQDAEIIGLGLLKKLGLDYAS
jgi:ABC-2 type transport system ATP-binding protein